MSQANPQQTQNSYVRKLALDIVGFLAIAIHKETSVAEQEVWVEGRLRELVDEVAKMFAQSNQSDNQQMYVSMQETVLNITADLAEARRLVILARETIEILKGEKDQLLAMKTEPDGRVGPALPWCEECRCFHHTEADHITMHGTAGE